MPRTPAAAKAPALPKAALEEIRSYIVSARTLVDEEMPYPEDAWDYLTRALSKVDDLLKRARK